MSKSQVQRLLDELRNELQRRATAPSKAAEWAVERCTDPLEEAQARTDADIAISGLNCSWETAKAVQEAIDRLRDGTYGLCQECGCEIRPKRLEAIPWARFCVRCQEELEALESERYRKVA